MASVTLKCLPHEKSVERKLIAALICVPLLKYRRHHKKSLPIIGSQPLADNLLVKIRSARAAARRGGFLPVNYCRPGGDFCGGGRSYNGTPAARRAVKLVQRVGDRLQRRLAWLGSERHKDR